MPRVAFNEIEADELRDEYGSLRDFLANNEEAVLILSMWPPSGQLFADIFIGEDRIDILNQRFQTRR